MKIAIITSGFLPIIDGVSISALQRLTKLSQWGHEVILFCPDYSSLEADYPNWHDYTGNILPRVKVVNLDSSSFVGLDYEPNVNRKSYQTVLKELEHFQPDIVHVDEPERLFVGFWRVAGIDYAKRVGIPCVSFFRTNFLDYLEDYFPLPKPIFMAVKFLLQQLIVWVYNSYDLTLVTSKITYPKVVNLGIKNAQYTNLVGFDSDRFSLYSPQADFFKSSYGLEIDKLTKVVFLGRLYPDKGWDFTLDAFVAVSEQIDGEGRAAERQLQHSLASGCGISFLNRSISTRSDGDAGSASKANRRIDLNKVAIIVAGDGPMRQEIADKLSKLTPNLHLLGRVSPEDIPALLVNCDLHVTTSEKETRGLTILEAFAAGIPVIAPNSGGVIENIQDGSNGFLYTPGDRLDFTRKLKILIENPSLRKEMGDRAYHSIQAYSWEQAIQNLVNVWQEAIDKQLPMNNYQ